MAASFLRQGAIFEGVDERRPGIMAASFLRQVAIFEGIDERRLAELEAGGEERRLGAHQAVYQRDDACDGLYLVKSGGVVIRHVVVGQPIERVRDVPPGD